MRTKPLESGDVLGLNGAEVLEGHGGKVCGVRSARARALREGGFVLLGLDGVVLGGRRPLRGR